MVNANRLRQWHAKYHPDFPPQCIETAAELEQAYGDILRDSYMGLGYRVLASALGKRRPKAVIVSERTCRTWLDNEREKCSAAMRRPAAVLKKPAASAYTETAERHAAPALQDLQGADVIEAAVGDRHRKEWSDLGLGIA